jgi:hypothetical protein
MTTLDQSVPMGAGQLSDAFSPFFVATMGGGTALAQNTPLLRGLANPELQEYVTIRAEVILQYERTILGLRQELLHYKRLLSRESRQVDQVGGYNGGPYAALDAASTALVNSILRAEISPTAAFTDFEEGEL